MAIVNNGVKSLLSATSRVEVPYIKVTLAGITFGVFTKETVNAPSGTTTPNLSQQYVNVTYPNFIQTLEVKKDASGLVNTYKLSLTYAIRPGDDPNLIEKILSKAKTQNRKITFSYGDANSPNFIYREETGLITKATQSMNTSNATINYVIHAVSNSATAVSTTHSFAKRHAQPSKVIKEILFNNQYKLKELYPGMKTLKQVEEEGFIASDDAVVDIEAKEDISVLTYLCYLVSCMRWVNDSPRAVKKSCVYHIATFDDISNDYGGAYFKVVRYTAKQDVLLEDEIDYVNVDIGYTDNASVVNFRVNNDEVYSILYDFNDSIDISEYQYDIDNNGQLITDHVNRLAINKQLNKVTEAEKTWWTQITQYPINATLVVRGLLRNILLMSKIKINIYFFGQKHIYSGIYIVNGQTDNVSNGGFRTTLSLTRVKGVSQEVGK